MINTNVDNEQVAKEDIQVRFFEEKQGVIVWEGYGDFQHTNVHKQVAISFRTPKYKTIEIEQPVKVNFNFIVEILHKLFFLLNFSALYNFADHQMVQRVMLCLSSIFHWIQVGDH